MRDWDPPVRAHPIRGHRLLPRRLRHASSRCDDVERALVEHEVDTVFHLGAQTARRDRPTAARYATFESNIRGTYNLLEACRAPRRLVRRVVVASSDKAYGECRGPAVHRGRCRCARDVTRTTSRRAAPTCSPVATRGPTALPGRGRPLRQHLRRRRPELEPDRSRARSGRSSADEPPVHPLRRHVPPRLPLRRRRRRAPTSRWPSAAESPRSRRGLQLQPTSRPRGASRSTRRAASCGSRSRRPRADDPEQAVGEIKTSTSTARKATRLLGWRPKWSLADGLAATIAWYRGPPRNDNDDTPSRSCAAEILSSRREYARVALPEKSVRRRTSPGPRERQGLRRRRDDASSVDASLDFWLTTGRYAEEFEKRLRAVSWACARAALQLGLVGQPPRALRAHLAPELGKRRLRGGRRSHHRRRRIPDHGQPDLPEPPDSGLRGRRARHLRREHGQVREAVGPKTRAIVMAHTLGNPFDLDAVMEIAAASTTSGSSRTTATRSARPTTASRSGPFGDLATIRASTPRTTSRWARAERAHAEEADAQESSRASATGAATAGAFPGEEHLQRASTGSWATFPTATTTSTSTRTSATT